MTTAQLNRIYADIMAHAKPFEDAPIQTDWRQKYVDASAAAGEIQKACDRWRERAKFWKWAALVTWGVVGMWVVGRIYG